MKFRFFASALLCGALAFSVPTAVSAEEVVAITSNGMAVDSFMGVEANYIMGTGNSNTGTYCCAAYVIKFYKEIYGVTVYNVNMVQGKPTVAMEGHTVSLVEVSEPKPGDMMQNLTYTHVAIVKSVTEDGTAILIEQNYKWSEGGQTVARVEREISFDEAHFYRLVIDGVEQYCEEGLEELAADPEEAATDETATDETAEDEAAEEENSSLSTLSSFEDLISLPSLTDEDLSSLLEEIDSCADLPY